MATRTQDLALWQDDLHHVIHLRARSAIIKFSAELKVELSLFMIAALHACRGKGVGLEWERVYRDCIDSTRAVLFVRSEACITTARIQAWKNFRENLGKLLIVTILPLVHDSLSLHCLVVADATSILVNAHHPLYFPYPHSPWRIIEDCGAAFVMGCIGGGLFSFWKGYRNSPVVSRKRLLCCACSYIHMYV